MKPMNFTFLNNGKIIVTESDTRKMDKKPQGTRREYRQVKNFKRRSMKKNLQIHVRVTPATRKQWDQLCEQSSFNTQSALFRKIVDELNKTEFKNLITQENE